MDFSSEFLQSLSKRAWRLSWVLILIALISLMVILSLVLYKNLYIPANFSTVGENYIAAIEFFTDALIVSLSLFGIFYIFKGDSNTTIKKLREKFYKKAIERVELVFDYRYNFPIDKYTNEIKSLTEYKKQFVKNEALHTINKNNLKKYIVDGVDSLYITYEPNSDEKILFSIWHSGSFIAIAIAVDINSCKGKTKDEVKSLFESKLNLTGSDSSEPDRLSIRDGYWWFDVKYKTSEEFLFNNVDQEQITRTIAHIVTIGISASMELMGWKLK